MPTRHQARNHHLNLTHWGRVTHICVGNLTIIGSDNGLSPDRRQAIIWTNTGILLIGPLGTNFSEILIGIQTFSFKKINLKMSSAKWRPFCLGLNVLRWFMQPHGVVRPQWVKMSLSPTVHTCKLYHRILQHEMCYILTLVVPVKNIFKNIKHNWGG